MKVIKNKTHYTVKKGMGNVVLGEIIDFESYKSTFYIQEDFSLGLDIEDLEFISKYMKKLKAGKMADRTVRGGD